MRSLEILCLLFSSLLIPGALFLDCSQPGWSSAETICFRLIHFPKSFWSAKDYCKLQNGELLQLKYVPEVLDALGETMWGNAGEYRIDGWANGTWFTKDNEVLDPSDHDSHHSEILGSFTGKTLTLDLQTGTVSAEADADARMGFVCQGDGTALLAACDKEEDDGEEEDEPEGAL